MTKVLNFDGFLNEKEEKEGGFFSKLKNKIKGRKKENPTPEKGKEKTIEDIKKEFQKIGEEKNKGFGEGRSVDEDTANRLATMESLRALKSKAEEDGKVFTVDSVKITQGKRESYELEDGTYVVFNILELDPNSFKKDLKSEEEAEDNVLELSKKEDAALAKAKEEKKKEEKKVEAVAAKEDKKEEKKDDKKGISTFTSKNAKENKDAVKSYKKNLSEMGSIDSGDVNDEYDEKARLSTLNAMRKLEAFTGKQYKESDEELFKQFQKDLAVFIEKKKEIRKALGY